MTAGKDILNTIQAMSWTKWDYDVSKLVTTSMPLQDFVNELAMTCVSSPSQIALDLLCAGTLTAVGYWQWRAYRNGEYYQNEGHGIIPSERWTTLVELKAECDNLPMELSYESKVNLKRLGNGETEKFYWDWREQQFSFAISDGDWPHEVEEFFSASGISLLAPILPNGTLSEPQEITLNPHLDLHKAEENVSSLPSEEAIEAKMKELIGMGIKRDVAAIVIRQISGFEAVGNEHARRTVAGKLPRGRPKKETA